MYKQTAVCISGRLFLYWVPKTRSAYEEGGAKRLSKY